MSGIEVIASESLSKDGEKRYVIVDPETGEILDDAQGYGFRSKRNAYAAYTHKQHNSHLKEERSDNYRE